DRRTGQTRGTAGTTAPGMAHCGVAHRRTTGPRVGVEFRGGLGRLFGRPRRGVRGSRRYRPGTGRTAREHDHRGELLRGRPRCTTGSRAARETTSRTSAGLVTAPTA